MEQTLINFDDIRVGDEVIISSHSNLKYLKILRISKNKRAKVSLRRDICGSNGYTWKVTKFETDTTKHNDVMYQDFYGKDIFLVKREEQLN